MRIKVGRNDLCPCGSGKKYKKCHYLEVNIAPLNDQLESKRKLAKRLQIEQQQGLGRPIVSAQWNGKRVIAVGNSLHFLGKDKTFHDFLISYIQSPAAFGSEWFKTEAMKSFKDRHPIAQWFELVRIFMQQHQQTGGRIKNAPMTGAVCSFLRISYNLYLLQHNVAIHKRLIKRLKEEDGFRGAKYETYVAAEFIKAGFLLELENEDDNTSTHCEFSATSKITGKKYSVEAKARQPYKKSIGISNQLYEALKKDAKYERVIFIDHNSINFSENTHLIIREIIEKESTLKIKDHPASPSYVFVTNYPFEYNLDGICEGRSGFACGFKIPDFSFSFDLRNIQEVLRSREKHRDMFDLVKSMCRHEEIPSTFDGEYPEFAYSSEKNPPRLLIGEKYSIPTRKGTVVVGVLEDAVVLESEKKVYGVYKTPSGDRQICADTLTENELMAYRRQPDTFFGVPLENNKQIKDPIDLFDLMHETYKKSTKEKLLEFLKDHPNFESLKHLNQEELAFRYCEALVNSDIRAGIFNRERISSLNGNYF